MAAADQRLLDGRRAFLVAQGLLRGVPTAVPRRLVVGWHDTSLHPEIGAFAVVATGGGNEDLVGEAVQVQFGPDLRVFVYVVDSAVLPDPWDISLARRAYWGLTRLSRSPIRCQVAVVA